MNLVAPGVLVCTLAVFTFLFRREACPERRRHWRQVIAISGLLLIATDRPRSCFRGEGRRLRLRVGRRCSRPEQIGVSVMSRHTRTLPNTAEARLSRGIQLACDRLRPPASGSGQFRCHAVHRRAVPVSAGSRHAAAANEDRRHLSTVCLGDLGMAQLDFAGPARSEAAVHRRNDRVRRLVRLYCHLLRDDESPIAKADGECRGPARLGALGQ